MRDCAWTLLFAVKKRQELKIMAELFEDKAALVTGLHSVSFSCGNVPGNNQFWTKILGLRRVKMTVDYDSPDCYHLYYGDEKGAAGTLISACARPKTPDLLPPALRQPETPRRSGQHHAVLAVRKGALPFWQQRLRKFGVPTAMKQHLGEQHLCFRGPCGERLEMTENTAEKRRGYRSAAAGARDSGIEEKYAICGLHSLSFAVWDREAIVQFLTLLGYREEKSEAGASRFILPESGAEAGLPANGARIIDVEKAEKYATEEEAARAKLEPGAVAYISFAAAADLARLQEIFLDNGYKVGKLRDNVYYTSFYLYAPQGTVVEIASAESGFARDESEISLGAALCLPKKLEHMRPFIEGRLQKLAA